MAKEYNHLHDIISHQLAQRLYAEMEHIALVETVEEPVPDMVASLSGYKSAKVRIAIFSDSS